MKLCIFPYLPQKGQKTPCHGSLPSYFRESLEEFQAQAAPATQPNQVMMKLQLPEGLEDEMQLMLLDKASRAFCPTNRSGQKNTKVKFESIVFCFPACVY